MHCQEAIGTNNLAWERLVKTAVQPAIYNAELRARSPCLENTRSTILRSIQQIVDEKSQKNVWLHGFPGSGKTSILYTIADELREQGRLAGTFFFSHNSVDATMCGYVVPTLAYQLALAFPSVKSDIIRTITDDPALLSDLKARKDQIQSLIVNHLWKLQFRSPLAFIIDALDESCCPLEAARVARLLAEAIRAYKVLEDKPLNAHIILASRSGLHFDDVVTGKGFGDIQEISLQDFDGETSADIRRFLAHELQRVVQSRKLSLGDIPQWPSPRQMDHLADKVGNSFLCASIAIKYITHPKKHPASRLDAFLSSPDATADAYADLDHMYQEIIRDSRSLIRYLIDIINLAQPLPHSQLLQFFPSDHSENLNLTLEEFSSILVVSPDKPMTPIQPYHSSLIEFFTDPVRCHPHHIEPAEIHKGLALQCLMILHTLKTNLCDLSDHTTMAVEDSHFWHKRDAMLPESKQYACRNWAHHLSHAQYDSALISTLENFLRVRILQWIEALCLLGELSDGPTMLRKARAAFSGWATSMRYQDFVLINRSLATAEQLIILYFDPISLFPLQVYYIVAALADLSGQPLDSNSNVLVRRCGPAPDSIYQFPVSELQSSLVNPGPSQERRTEEAHSGISGVLADCCRWLSNSDFGAFHMSDLTLDLSLSVPDIVSFQEEDHLLDGPTGSNIGSVKPRRLWVCLEITSETCQQSSPIQQIVHNDHLRVELGSMTILADSDHRCQLRVLLSTSKKKPSKPGMILGEWLFSFETLMERSGSDNRLRLCMYHQRLASPCRGRTAVGNLSFTISPTPAFSTSKQGQILGQFPGPHPSNQSSEMFTAPPDLSWSKKGGGNSGEGSRGGSQRDLPSVLDLNLAFKGPDEYERPESPIRRTRTTAVFRDLKRKLRMYMLRARHPIIYARYINSLDQQEHSNVSFAVSTVIIVTDSDVDGSCLH